MRPVRLPNTSSRSSMSVWSSGPVDTAGAGGITEPSARRPSEPINGCSGRRSPGCRRDWDGCFRIGPGRGTGCSPVTRFSGRASHTYQADGNEHGEVLTHAPIITQRCGYLSGWTMNNP